GRRVDSAGHRSYREQAPRSCASDRQQATTARALSQGSGKGGSMRARSKTPFVLLAASLSAFLSLVLPSPEAAARHEPSPALDLPVDYRLAPGSMAFWTGETGPTGPLYTGPKQYPFICTTSESGLGQPIVDNQDGIGNAVYAVEGNPA